MRTVPVELDATEPMSSLPLLVQVKPPLVEVQNPPTVAPRRVELVLVATRCSPEASEATAVHHCPDARVPRVRLVQAPLGVFAAFESGAADASGAPDTMLASSGAASVEIAFSARASALPPPSLPSGTPPGLCPRSPPPPPGAESAFSRPHPDPLARTRTSMAHALRPTRESRSGDVKRTALAEELVQRRAGRRLTPPPSEPLLRAP
jgi:hypothetical protein